MIVSYTSLARSDGEGDRKRSAAVVGRLYKGFHPRNPFTMNPAPRKLALAKQMRRTLTTPEHLLWDRLKTRDGSGLSWRRQHPKGPFILDFYCHKVRLCVEIDGALHDHDRDQQRDAWLMAQGITVYRIPASEVFRDPDATADGVKLLADEMLRSK